MASEFGHGFIFDLKSLQPISEVKVGKKPNEITYDPATKHIYAMNGDSDSASVIDPADGRVIGTVGLVFMSNGGGNVSIYHEDGKDKFSLMETVVTKIGSKTTGLEPKPTICCAGDRGRTVQGARLGAMANGSIRSWLPGSTFQGMMDS